MMNHYALIPGEALCSFNKDFPEDCLYSFGGVKAELVSADPIAHSYSIDEKKGNLSGWIFSKYFQNCGCLKGYISKESAEAVHNNILAVDAMVEFSSSAASCMAAESHLEAPLYTHLIRTYDWDDLPDSDTMIAHAFSDALCFASGYYTHKPSVNTIKKEIRFLADHVDNYIDFCMQLSTFLAIRHYPEISQILSVSLGCKKIMIKEI